VVVIGRALRRRCIHTPFASRTIHRRFGRVIAKRPRALSQPPGPQAPDGARRFRVSVPPIFNSIFVARTETEETTTIPRRPGPPVFWARPRETNRLNRIRP